MVNLRRSFFYFLFGISQSLCGMGNLSTHSVVPITEKEKMGMAGWRRDLRWLLLLDTQGSKRDLLRKPSSTSAETPAPLSGSFLGCQSQIVPAGILQHRCESRLWLGCGQKTLC